MNSLLVTIGLLFCLAAVNAQYFGSSGCQLAQNRCDNCRQGCQNICQQARNTCADIFAGSSTTTWSTTTFSSTTSPYSTTSYYPSSSTTYYPSSSTTYYPYSSSTTDSSGIGGGYFGNGGRRGGRRGGNVRGGGSLGRRVVDPVPVVSRPVEAPCQGLSCFLGSFLSGSNIAGVSNGDSNVVGGNNGLRRVNTGQVVGGNNGIRRVSTGGVTNVHNGGQTGGGIDGILNSVVGGGIGSAGLLSGLNMDGVFGKK